MRRNYRNFLMKQRTIFTGNATKYIGFINKLNIVLVILIKFEIVS